MHLSTKDTPFYVGMSKGVIDRINQHLKGHSHHNSTLAYQLGLLTHHAVTGKEYLGNRDGLDITFVSPAREFLMKQKLAFIHIENPEQLYLFDIFSL